MSVNLEELEILWNAATELGLTPFPTHFEVVPVHVMYQLGAYGLPGRFSHWTHGRAYHLLKTRYDYGLQRIYELVINTDPCEAFLLEGNSELENKLTVAHVLAHSDFFRNNIHFRDTDRRMADTALVHAERLRRYELAHGTHEVETLLDAAIALQEHSTPYAGTDVYRPRGRRPASEFDDLLELGTQKRSAFEAVQPLETGHCPELDLLYFLLHYSPRLEDWERDVVSIVRAEWLYFYPQVQTKIANEGWASYWHREILRSLDLSQEEYIQFAALHAHVTAPSRLVLNPYHLGYKVWEHIAETEGRNTLFEVRELESDVSLLRNHLDEDLVRELDLFSYELKGTRWTVTDTANEWETVRDNLVAELVDRGVPSIQVADDDYRGSRELYLFHDYDGVELDQRHAQKTLEYLYRLWGRPVHLETVFGDMLTELTCRAPGEIQVESRGRYVS